MTSKRSAITEATIASPIQGFLLSCSFLVQFIVICICLELKRISIHNFIKWKNPSKLTLTSAEVGNLFTFSKDARKFNASSSATVVRQLTLKAELSKSELPYSQLSVRFFHKPTLI